MQVMTCSAKKNYVDLLLKTFCRVHISDIIICGMFQSFYQVAVLLVLNFAGLSILGLSQDSNHAHAVEVKNTMIFNAFVMCQVGKIISSFQSSYS